MPSPWGWSADVSRPSRQRVAHTGYYKGSTIAGSVLTLQAGGKSEEGPASRWRGQSTPMPCVTSPCHPYSASSNYGGRDAPLQPSVNASLCQRRCNQRRERAVYVRVRVNVCVCVCRCRCRCRCLRVLC